MNLYDLVSTPDGLTELKRQIASLSYQSVEELNHSKFKNEEVYALFSDIFESVDERAVSCLTDVLDVDLYNSLDINQIYLIVTFAAALESAELVKYLHKFG